MPDVSKYDGTSYPQEHITTYTTAVKGNDLAPHEIESVLLKKFEETLTNGALTWYSFFPEHSINSFDMLAYYFIKAHAGAKKVQARKANIFRIAQEESELLQEFADVHNRYESKIRIEDDQLSFPVLFKGRDWEKNKEKSKDDFDTTRRSSRSRFLPYERSEECDRGFRSADRCVIDRRIDRGWNNKSLQDKETSGSRDSPYLKLSEYNFNVSVVELVSSMRNIKEAQFPKPTRSDPSQRDPNLWCEYHGTNGHRIGDCRYLHEEVATLLKNGHLMEFLSHRDKNNYGRNRDNTEPSKAGEDPLRLMINMIFGGTRLTGLHSRQQNR
uniref:Retrotransposon gag domain-containing protein n=1 Tax=Nicotiana tabacum TaxID=4097 RepID=A0A1S3XSQ0_TOBAC|nr:PREDICTED: uncharacterized protein LOC107768361 [Nicotiana tabacum]